MYVLGIDIGTTGTKSAVIDLQGNVKGKGYKDYRLFTSEGGIVEQNANDWWDAVVESVRIATCSISDKSAIKVLALSTQGARTIATLSPCAMRLRGWIHVQALKLFFLVNILDKIIFIQFQVLKQVQRLILQKSYG